MSQQDIQEIEIAIEHAQAAVERGRLAESLADIPAFRKLVLEGYFVEEAARLAHLFADPSISEEIRAHVLRDLTAPGSFKRYLGVLVQIGRRAEREISEAEEAMEEIRSEELTGGNI